MVDQDVVHVWSIHPDDLPAPVLTDLWGVLDDDERRRATAREAVADRRRFVAAHGALRVIVSQAVGAAPETIRWRRGRHGKPQLAGGRIGVQVNLAHSGELALVAVTDRRPVGVDVERRPPGRTAARLAARFFPAEEAGQVATGDADRFAALWARKEACVKAAGGRLVQGLAVPVAGRGDVVVRCALGTYLVRDVPAPPAFRAAVALAGTGAYRVSCRSWWP